MDHYRYTKLLTVLVALLTLMSYSESTYATSYPSDAGAIDGCIPIDVQLISRTNGQAGFDQGQTNPDSVGMGVNCFTPTGGDPCVQYADTENPEKPLLCFHTWIWNLDFSQHRSSGAKESLVVYGDCPKGKSGPLCTKTDCKDVDFDDPEQAAKKCLNFGRDVELDPGPAAQFIASLTAKCGAASGASMAPTTDSPGSGRASNTANDDFGGLKNVLQNAKYWAPSCFDFRSWIPDNGRWGTPLHGGGDGSNGKFGCGAASSGPGDSDGNQDSSTDQGDAGDEVSDEQDEGDFPSINDEGDSETVDVTTTSEGTFFNVKPPETNLPQSPNAQEPNKTKPGAQPETNHISGQEPFGAYPCGGNGSSNTNPPDDGNNGNPPSGEEPANDGYDRPADGGPPGSGPGEIADQDLPLGDKGEDYLDNKGINDKKPEGPLDKAREKILEILKGTWGSYLQKIKKKQEMDDYCASNRCVGQGKRLTDEQEEAVNDPWLNPHTMTLKKQDSPGGHLLKAAVLLGMPTPASKTKAVAEAAAIWTSYKEIQALVAVEEAAALAQIVKAAEVAKAAAQAAKAAEAAAEAAEVAKVAGTLTTVIKRGIGLATATAIAKAVAVDNKDIGATDPSKDAPGEDSGSGVKDTPGAANPDERFSFPGASEGEAKVELPGNGAADPTPHEAPGSGEPGERMWASKPATEELEKMIKEMDQQWEHLSDVVEKLNILSGFNKSKIHKPNSEGSPHDIEITDPKLIDELNDILKYDLYKLVRQIDELQDKLNLIINADWLEKVNESMKNAAEEGPQQLMTPRELAEQLEQAEKQYFNTLNEMMECAKLIQILEDSAIFSGTTSAANSDGYPADSAIDFQQSIRAFKADYKLLDYILDNLDTFIATLKQELIEAEEQAATDPGNDDGGNDDSEDEENGGESN